MCLAFDFFSYKGIIDATRGTMGNNFPECTITELYRLIKLTIILYYYSSRMKFHKVISQVHINKQEQMAGD